MSEDPKNQQTCEVCQQSFNSEKELQSHQDNTHGSSEAGDRQSKLRHRNRSAEPKENRVTLFREGGAGETNFNGGYK